MSRNALGEFEHQVLLAVMLVGGKGYSAPIVMELEAKTGRSVSAGAVFIALRRLEQRGLLRSVKRDAKPGEGGRGRRIFEVTPAAVSKVRESRRVFESLWSGLDPAFDRS